MHLRHPYQPYVFAGHVPPIIHGPIIILKHPPFADSHKHRHRSKIEAASFQADLRFAANGEEFLAYLRRQPPWENAERPDLILLDLNIPRMDGREALREIKSDPALRAVPVVVFTNSRSPEDIAAAYDYGANTYIAKPHSLEELVGIVRMLGDFWFRISMLPGTTRSRSDERGAALGGLWARGLGDRPVPAFDALRLTGRCCRRLATSTSGKLATIASARWIRPGSSPP